MTGRLQDRVAIVTGATAGLGRAEALALGAAGARVVVNDLADGLDDVVGEIAERGGKALAVSGDVAERATADALTEAAVEHFGGLHVLVNNAGVLRDRMLFNLSDEDWDTVIRVHLRGHFLLSRNASSYWRGLSKETGAPVIGAVVNTASEAFLAGAAGQPNYAAAKAGIAALTVSTARGMARYGVRANAICPRARTAMTTGVFESDSADGVPADAVDPLSVEHVAPFVAFLASDDAADINGQVFVVHGGTVALLAPPTMERRFDTAGDYWTLDELADQVGGYFRRRDPGAMFSATEVLELTPRHGRST